MSWYEFLLFVHVSGAVIWIGGGSILQVYGMMLRRGGDADEIARFAGRAGVLGERLFVPVAVVVLLAGIGLMIEGSWSWSDLWVVYALVAFAASFVIGVAVLTPQAKKLPVVGPATPEGQELIARIFGILRADLVLLFSIVFAMTVKPTTDDLWTVVLAAAVGIALAAWFLVSSRGGQTSSSTSAAPPAT